METLSNHYELFLGAGLALLTLLLPAVNRRLALFTHHRWLKKGWEVADAMKDGAITSDEVESLLSGRKPAS